MALPFSLKIAGVNSGNDILALPSPTALTTPYVDLGTLSMTSSADGDGGSMTFDIIQRKTPSGTTPWYSDAYDNARVQFFDSRYSSTTPIFLGFISDISATLLENGLGTRATVTVEDADAWLDRTIVRRATSDPSTVMDTFIETNPTQTDQEMIDKILRQIDLGRTDATSQQLLNTSVISGTTRGIYTGTAQTIGAQTFVVTTLRSALDQIAEVSGGLYEIQYRYFIDNDGRLNYGPKETAQTFASAPAEIVTDPADVRTGSTTTTTRLFAREIAVGLDHGSIVKGIFTQVPSAIAKFDSNNATPTTGNPTNQPYFRTYNGAYWTSNTPNGQGTSRDGAGLATRNGPRPDEIFTGPKILADAVGGVGGSGYARGKKISDLTRATFVSRAKPIRTVSFIIGGGNLSQTSSPDWSYGYSQGYALDAPISSVSRTGTTATITTSVAHRVAVGDTVTIALSSGPTGYTALNGTWTVTAPVTSTTFTFTTVTTGTITANTAVGTIYRLAKGWFAGGYVKVNAPMLGLANVYLFIPTITMRFAEGGGTYQAEYEIQADYRRLMLSGLKGITPGG
jgi:hypothetical protein